MIMILLLVVFGFNGYLGSEAILVSDNIKKLIQERNCDPFENFNLNLSELYTYCNVKDAEDPEKFVSNDEHPLVCKALYESVDLVCSNPPNPSGAISHSFCAYQWSKISILDSHKSVKNIKSLLSLFPQYCEKICEDLNGKDRPACTAIGLLLLDLEYLNRKQPSSIQLENNAVGKNLMNNLNQNNSTKLANNGVSNGGSGSELTKSVKGIGGSDSEKPVNGVSGSNPGKMVNSVSGPPVKIDNGIEQDKPLGNRLSRLEQKKSVNGLSVKSFPGSEKAAGKVAEQNMPLSDGNVPEMPENDFQNIGNDDLKADESPNRKDEKSDILPSRPADNPIPPARYYPGQDFEDEEQGDFDDKNFAANHPPEPEKSIPEKGAEEPNDSPFLFPPDRKNEKLNGINDAAKNEETNAEVGDGEKLKADGYTVVVQQDTFVEAEDSHFLKYFILFSIVSFICYISLHNKRKIMALLIEGRQGRSKRRPSSSAYSKLDSNLEEAMMSDAPKYTKSIVY